MDAESRFENHLNRARNCGPNIDQVNGVPILLPNEMTSQELASLELESRHTQKASLIAGSILDIYMVKGLNRIERARGSE